MEGETPRTLIKGVLQTSHSTRSSPGRKQTPSSSRESPRTLPSRSVSRPSQQPISSGKVSSSVKRPARGSLTSEAKRRRSVTATPRETITPRTNIRAYLTTADTKTPAQSSATRASRQRLSRSAISNRQVEKLVASESESRRTSLRRKSLSQSFPTPTESITPREAMKLYLKAADTVPRARRSTPRRSNIKNVEANQDESSEEKQEDSESAAADDEQSQDEETKPESGAESGEYGDENVQSGDGKGESDERAESVGERAESGDERAESEDEKSEFDDESQEDDRPDQGTELHVFPPSENKYESSHDATADSSQDEQEVAGQGSGREQDSLQEDMSSQDEQQMDDATNQSRMQGSLQGGEHETMSGVENKSGHSRSGVEWGKLRTPILPDTTTVKATPIVLVGNPPRPAQQKKPSNVRKASGKGNQAKQQKKKASSVLRLPSSLVNGIFRHFSALRVSKDALDAVQVGSDAFFTHIATDLTSYCKHAGRKTIEESDAELLMRRQGLVKSRESFHALIEKYLPMEYRQEIIPIAKSGNKVVPKEKT